MIKVSVRACERFQQFVRPCTIGEAYREIISHSRALEAAASFGCHVIRCAGGERLVLERRTVVGVYGRGEFPSQCRNPYRIGGHA